MDHAGIIMRVLKLKYYTSYEEEVKIWWGWFNVFIGSSTTAYPFTSFVAKMSGCNLYKYTHFLAAVHNI